MKVVTAAEMSTIEKAAESQYHISPLILMENAGKEAALYIKSNLLKDFKNQRVAIFAGKGNNAGDGFVVARHLHNIGAHIRVILLNKPEEFSSDALQNFKIIKSMGLRIQYLASEKDLQTLKIALLYTDVIVDAIYGTGFKGEPPVFVSKVFDVINSSCLSIVALDIPSGVEADTGAVNGNAVKAGWTITMGLPKLGLVINPGSEYTGKLSAIDISLPKPLLTDNKLLRNIISAQLCAGLLPLRKLDSHKGTYGHLIIVGGSNDMSGAAILAAHAATRSGCGLVTLALPLSLQQRVLGQIPPQIMTKGLKQTDKISIAKEALKELDNMMERIGGIVIGPGMSRHPETLNFVREVIIHSRVPVVIDADALFAFKGKTELLKKASVPLLLTPHPGEMAMLTDKNIEEVQKNRLQIAENFSKEYGVTLVLKGYRTIISSPTGESFIATTGNSGLAKGGTGDVLAGIIGSLVVQGIKPQDAAVIGVYIHGRSGDLCANELSTQGMNALDVIEKLNIAWKEIEKN